ncbi:MAG TPA: DUF1501 domain-containing protein [Ktedonobacterales bacterium]|nr:DUF1501 domain-containing protein [Ktedonobacterales bacterium]
MFMTRRAMIRDGLLSVSAGMIIPSVFARAVRAAQNAAAEGASWAQAAQNRTLIVVQMAGGNDGLNTIVPYTDPNYHHLRPSLALGASDVLPLNDHGLAMHASMKSLVPFWQKGKLAIVEGVGYPDSSLSHFQAMDIWQTLDLQGTGSTGWLGKYVSGLVDQDGHPFKSLAMGSTLPMALQALNANVPVVSTPQTYRVLPDPATPKDTQSPQDQRLQALLKLYNTYPKSAPYAALLDATAQTATQGAKALADTSAQYKAAVTYPKTNLAAGLQVMAEVIANGLGLRVGYVTLGGFDTHADQLTTQASLLAELSDALAAFYADLTAHNVADNVVIMTWSEFGRRVLENGSAGTDHGTAAPLFVLGNAVTGGLYGEPPDLTNLDTYGNLKFGVDFRSVYATVLDRWLGAPSAAVLGGDYGEQTFLPSA